jgi:hypothetical protein
MRGAALILGSALLSGACAREAPVPANGTANAAAPAPATPAPAANAANAAAPAPASPTAPRTYTLAGNGIDPGIRFGMAEAEALAAARAAFGEPTGRREHNDECGEGPMDFVAFHDLHLGFQDGRLVGWSLGGRSPPLRTAGGLAVGAPRSVLGTAEIDRESSLGPEFAVDEVGGILDQDARRIEALWAGSTCQFR